MHFIVTSTWRTTADREASVQAPVSLARLAEYVTYELARIATTMRATPEWMAMHATITARSVRGTLHTWTTPQEEIDQ